MSEASIEKKFGILGSASVISILFVCRQPNKASTTLALGVDYSHLENGIYRHRAGSIINTLFHPTRHFLKCMHMKRVASAQTLPITCIMHHVSCRLYIYAELHIRGIRISYTYRWAKIYVCTNIYAHADGN